jgi:hypothetical protein
MNLGSKPGHGGRRRSCAATALAFLLLSGAAGTAGAATRADDPTGHEFGVAPLTAPAGDRAPRDLRELLAVVDGDLPLRVTRVTRHQVVGHPWRVYGDTLLLVPPPDWRSGRTPAREVLLGVALDDIARIEQSRSGVRAGAGWGARSGALVVGGLGLLVGAAVSALTEGDSDVTPVVAFGAIGAGVGALAGGGIGAGVGALGRHWVTIWPFEAAGESRPPGNGDDGGRSRFALEGAWSFDDAAEQDGRGPGVRVGIVRRVGGLFELGPFAEYHDLDGLYRYPGSGPYYPSQGEFLVARSRRFALGLDLRAQGRAEGLRPCGTAGLAWFLGDGLYFGAHAGAGLRWRQTGGHEVTLFVRRYFSVVGSESRESRFWSVAAGVTFGAR